VERGEETGAIAGALPVPLVEAQLLPAGGGQTFTDLPTAIGDAGEVFMINTALTKVPYRGKFDGTGRLQGTGTIQVGAVYQIQMFARGPGVSAFSPGDPLPDAYSKPYHLTISQP
jgi:hypothetical protein